MSNKFLSVWRDGDTVYIVEAEEMAGRPFFKVTKTTMTRRTVFMFHGDFSFETADNAPSEFFRDYIKAKTELIEQENTAEDYGVMKGDTQ